MRNNEKGFILKVPETGSLFSFVVRFAFFHYSGLLTTVWFVTDMHVYSASAAKKMTE